MAKKKKKKKKQRERERQILYLENQKSIRVEIIEIENGKSVEKIKKN